MKLLTIKEKREIPWKKLETADYVEGTKIHIITDFSSETLENTRQWNYIFKALDPIYSEFYMQKVIFFKNEGKVAIFKQIKTT